MIPFEPSPAARAFLEGHENVFEPEALFQAYAQYLLHTSGALELPVPLKRIRAQHGFKRQEKPMPQRGFLLGDAIFVNSDDPASVQRFTEAHEMMETLFVALRAEGFARLSPEAREGFESRKEQCCESGAAELLMPAELFSPQVREWGTSLAATRQLAQLCGTSLTATARKMLAVDERAAVFALLKEGHKKSQFVPSKVGQGVLWGSPQDWDPPAELRVWRRWSSPQVGKDKYLVWNESFGRDGIVHQAWRARAFGKILRGSEQLDLEFIQGLHEIEAMLVSIEGAPVVMVFIQL